MPELPPGTDGICAAPECQAAANYRAPHSRRDLHHYIWLCLDHVREYNAAWNYYAGMSEREIEAHRRADVTWRRPSWPFGANGPRRAGSFDPEIRDDFGIFSDAAGSAGQWEGTRSPGWEPETEEQKALAVLDLSPPVTASQVKTKYKELVKEFHPDANGGDKAAEDRLKLINHAYSTLKQSEWLLTETRE